MRDLTYALMVATLIVAVVAVSTPSRDAESHAATAAGQKSALLSAKHVGIAKSSERTLIARGPVNFLHNFLEPAESSAGESAMIDKSTRLVEEPQINQRLRANQGRPALPSDSTSSVLDLELSLRLPGAARSAEPHASFEASTSHQRIAIDTDHALSGTRSAGQTSQQDEQAEQLSFKEAFKRYRSARWAHRDYRLASNEGDTTEVLRLKKASDEALARLREARKREEGTQAVRDFRNKSNTYGKTHRDKNRRGRN